MAFEDRLRPSSYRGVPYVTVREEIRTGKRLQVLQYPRRNAHSTEELGLEAPSYAVIARVYGPDYDQDRDRLLEALRKDGAGLWVSQRHGEMQAHAAQIGETEDDSALERAEFSLVFTPASPVLEPRTRVDTRAAVHSLRSSTLAAVASHVGQVLEVAGWPSWIESSAVTRADGILAEVEAGVAQVRAADEDVADVRRSLGSLRSGLAARIYDAGDFAAAATGQVDALADLPGSASALFAVGSGLLSTGSGWNLGPKSSARSATQDAANAAALQRMGRVSGVALMSSAAARIAPDSSTEAAGLRDEIVAAIDSQIDDAAAESLDELYLALRQLRAGVVVDLNDRAALLPRRLEIDLPISIPAVVLSQRLYGTPNREAEIVARNRIKRPLFVTGPIEILSDAVQL